MSRQRRLRSTERQCYAYDGLSRLTDARTTTGDCAQDPSGAFAASGPGGYWTTWEYNATAGRTSQVQHQVPGTTTTTGDITTTYAYTDPDHPHALTRASTTSPTGSTTQTLTHDATGSTTARTTTGTIQGLPWTPAPEETGTGTTGGNGSAGAGTATTAAPSTTTSAGTPTVGGAGSSTPATGAGTAPSTATGAGAGTDPDAGGVLAGLGRAWGGSRAVGVQAFAYGPTGALEEVSTGPDADHATRSTVLVRDADGDLLVQRSAGQGRVIAYLGDQEAQWDTATDTLSGRRYYTVGAGGAGALRTGNGAGDYQLLVSDAQGTGAITLDPGAQRASYQDYTPYGQIRARTENPTTTATTGSTGTGVDPVTAWTDPHEYLGLPTDPATGLNLLGAREYDPVLGVFLQLDPVLDPGDPGQIGGYAYAGSDPLNASDPTGLWVFFKPDYGYGVYSPGYLASPEGKGLPKTKPRKKKNQSWWKDTAGTAGKVAGATGNALGSAGNAAWDAGTSTVNTLDPYARSLGRHLPSIVEGTTSLAGGGFAIFKGFGTVVGGCTAGAATGPGELVICTAAIAEGGTEIAIGTKRATDGIRKLSDDIQEINAEVNAGDRVIGPPDAPARFVVTSSGKVVDRAAVATRISRQRQERHIKGDPKRKERSYFRKLEEAQDVLDSFHDGTAEVIGVKGSDVVVRNTRVTGYNNNPQSGYADQPTHVFFIKGTRSPSVVPYNPNWRP